MSSDLHAANCQRCHIAARCQSPRDLGICQHSSQFLLKPLGDAVLVLGAEAAQHQAIDVQSNALHTQSLISAPVKERSRFAPSLWAECSRWLMRTGSPVSAARNAALSAMLRMLPPATWSCASFR